MPGVAYVTAVTNGPNCCPLYSTSMPVEPPTVRLVGATTLICRDCTYSTGTYSLLMATCTPASSLGICPCASGWYATPVAGPISKPVSVTSSPGAIPAPASCVAALSALLERHAGLVQPPL